MSICRIGLAVMLPLVFAATAQASLGFRCGGDIIDVGDSEAELLEKCGEPDFREGYRMYYERDGQDYMIEVHIGADGNINRIGERHE